MGVPALAPANVIICSLLMTISMIVAYITKKLRFVYLPESASAMIIGMFFGGVSVTLNMNIEFSFSPQIFFYGLLPIIIFNAGYALKKKDFFRNIVSIALFAVLGTIISTLVYGLSTYYLSTVGYIKLLSEKSPLLEALMYGSLMSATDPVATLSIFQDMNAPTALYNLVFGESLVNDASSIVLFKTFELFMESEFSFSSIGVAIVWFCCISVGSLVIGITISLLCSLLLKNIDVHSEHARFELSFILMSAYLSYSLAEIMGLSGIMSLFICGICNSHYGYYNMSHASKVSSKYAFESLSYMAELFVFAYLGMQVVILSASPPSQYSLAFDSGLLLSSIPICFLSRACNIFPLSWLANQWRADKITVRMQVMMWFSGLRGAIAYSLALNMPTHNPALLTTTLFVVVTTSIVLGGCTSSVLQLLQLTHSHRQAKDSLHSMDMPLVDAMESMVDLYTKRPPAGLHKWFKAFDEKYVKPFFGGKVIVGPLSIPRNGLQSVAGDAEQASLVGSTEHSLSQYDGLGFSLSLPADWEEVFEADMEDTVLLHLCLFSNGGAYFREAVASIRVTWHQSPIGDNGLDGFKDPMEFLTRTWHELDFGNNDDIPIFESQPASDGVSELRSTSGRQAAMSAAFASEGQNCCPGAVIESETSDPAGLNFLKTKYSAADLVDQSGPAMTPTLQRSLSRHVLIPAFVMWADSALDANGQLYFRYEIMLHPEDMAGSNKKIQIKHLLLTVAARDGFIYCCQAKGTEAWWSQGGGSLARIIVETFSLGTT